MFVKSNHCLLPDVTLGTSGMTMAIFAHQGSDFRSYCPTLPFGNQPNPLVNRNVNSATPVPPASHGTGGHPFYHSGVLP